MDNSRIYDKNLLDELIGRFFHKESFFYYNISHYAGNIKKSNTPLHENIASLIKQIVEKLTQAENKIHLLEHLSAQVGFNDFYIHLRKFISQLDFKNANQEKSKQHIYAVSQFFISQLELKLRHPEVRRHIVHFLDNNQFSSQDIAQTTSKIPSNFTGFPTRQNNKIFIQNSYILVDFFKYEIDKSFHPLMKYDSPKLSNLIHDEFLSDWKICALRIKFMAMMHGYDEIEAIADRMIRLLDCLKKYSIMRSNHVVALLLSAKNFISGVFSEKFSTKLLLSLLKDFDNYILKIEHNRTKGSREKSPANSLKNINPSEYRINSRDNDESIENINDADNFKIPGEDDPELLSLLKEVSESRSNLKFRKIKSQKPLLVKNVTGELLKKNLIQEIENELEKTLTKSKKDNDSILFRNDIAGIMKFIKSAIATLSKDNGNESALEDLTLAFSTLKNYRYEKHSQIPNLMESIAHNSTDRNFKLPIMILVSIVNAITLLRHYSNSKNLPETLFNICNELNHHLLKLRVIKKRYE